MKESDPPNGNHETSGANRVNEGSEAFWKGPIFDGITQSLINDWLGCPFGAYIKLILGLQESVPPQENLMWGDTYHVGLEHLLASKDRNFAIGKALEHLQDKYPIAPPTFKYSIPRMLRLYKLKGHMEADWKTEVLIDQHVTLDATYTARFRGKMDGIAENHGDYDRVLAEHKCKGYTDPAQIREEIGQDLQCNLYMFLNNIEHVAYDLIKIPDTQKYGPARNYHDSPEDYIEKLFCGPIGSYGNNYPINRYADKWIHQEVFFLHQEEQELYWAQTIRPITLRIMEWYEYVTSPEFDYQNPNCYNSIFYKMPVRHFSGRKTEKFKCPYHSYLIGETDLEDLVPIPSLFSELET